MTAHIYTHVYGCHEGQMRESDPLELELQEFCEQPGMGAGKWTSVFQKTNKWSFCWAISLQREIGERERERTDTVYVDSLTQWLGISSVGEYLPKVSKAPGFNSSNTRKQLIKVKILCKTYFQGESNTYMNEIRISFQFGPQNTSYYSWKHSKIWSLKTKTTLVLSFFFLFFQHRVSCKLGWTNLTIYRQGWSWTSDPLPPPRSARIYRCVAPCGDLWRYKASCMLCHPPDDHRSQARWSFCSDSLAHAPVCATTTSPSILDKGCHPVACKGSQD